MKQHRTKFSIAIVMFILTLCSYSFSRELPPTPVPPFYHVGAQLDVGVPDGLALGVVVKPKWYWLAVGFSGTYNTIATGMRGSMKLDPIKFPVRLTLTGEYGYSFAGNISKWMKNDVPNVDYTYVNLHPGIEFGSNNGFSLFVHAGPSWVNFNTSNFQKAVVKNNDVKVSDPHGSFFIVPSVKFGFVLLFL